MAGLNFSNPEGINCQAYFAKPFGLAATGGNILSLGVLRDPWHLGDKALYVKITFEKTAISCKKPVFKLLSSKFVPKEADMPLADHDIMNGFPYHIVANGQLGAGFKECSDLEAGHVTLSRGALV